MKNPTVFLSVIVIIFLGSLVYFNSLNNSFVWDDKDLIVENSLIKNWNHVGDIFKKDLFYATPERSFYYRPIQTFSYAIDYSIYHLQPKGYHFTNLILHLFNAVLVYFLTLVFLKNKATSFFAASIFVVHPIHTAAVAFISGRADLLFTLFFLAAFLLFIKSEKLLQSKQIFLYIVALLFYLCALLSKESALIIPFLILIYQIIFEKKENENITHATIKTLPFFVLSILYLGLRFYIFRFQQTLFPIVSSSFIERFIIWCKALILYIKLLIVPVNLHMGRNIAVAKNIFQPETVISILSLFVIVILSIIAFRKSKTIFFFIAWFFLLLIPTSGLIPLNVTAQMAEHWLYLPSIGFFVIGSTVLSNFITTKQNWLRIIAITLFTALMLCYGFFTISYNKNWRDPITLFKYTLKYAPNAYTLYNNLGLEFENAGLFDEAEKVYNKSLEITPNYARAYDNLGSLYAKKGDFDTAMKLSNKAIELDSKNPRNYNNRGVIYAQKGEFDLAIKDLKKALDLFPDYARAHNNLGNVYVDKGQIDLAIVEYKKAIELNPDYEKARDNLKKILADKK